MIGWAVSFILGVLTSLLGSQVFELIQRSKLKNKQRNLKVSGRAITLMGEILPASRWLGPARQGSRVRGRFSPRSGFLKSAPRILTSTLES